MRRRLKLTVPERTPFFRVGDHVFVDVIYAFGEDVTVDVEALVKLLASARPGEVVVGRKLDRREKRFLDRNRSDGDSETFALMITTDAARWKLPGR